MHHAAGLRLGRFVIPDDRRELALRPEYAHIFADVGANYMDYPDVTLADLRHALERAVRESRSLEWIITSAGYDWSGYAFYAELDAVDLDSLTPQDRASHVATVHAVTVELLDTHDFLVALGGDRLDLGRASGAESAAAPEAVDSPPPDLRPPSEGSASPSPRGSTRPLQDRPPADESMAAVCYVMLSL